MFSRCSQEQALRVLLHLPAAQGGHDAPCNQQLCMLNAFIPMPCCSPASYQWPYTTSAKEKAQQEGCNSIAFP